ncbi:AAA family ATPase [Butyrivibrio sp. AC2005]|uniref:AAA family ATPase n=1 Tax=Butyrivibrio sp. AC2005 TaxID=1280672 RepID=UPI00040BFE65|nr:AAA family ATPase [Butyrivibrio sp. AC2005]
MGTYLNPGNNGFAEMINGKYVDKTGLIEVMNGRVNTTDKLVCISRPRRFGKSFAVDMLSAYYDCTCDSQNLFTGLDISHSKEYECYLNKYNVITIDIAGALSKLKRNKKSVADIVDFITEGIRADLIEVCPQLESTADLSDCIEKYVEISGKEFIFIIDEWDAVIREAKEDDKTQESYLNLLREWFKNRNFTPKVVAAAYMTGILPIKKDGSESAISDFKEYTIIDPGPFTKYTGFTETEVKNLCEEYHRDFNLIKQWYDGYEFEEIGALYNPYSVMEAVKSGDYSSHWRKTSAAENLVTYINMNEDGLQEDILKLLSGEHLRVNIRNFKNDFESFSSKDDVITLLIHLGYLTYDKKSQRVRIPNEEVKQEFTDIIENPKHTKLLKLIQTSEMLLEDTIAGNEEAVASAIEKVRESNYAPQYYNNEQALRYAIKFAYIVCVDRFLRIEELPSGRGLADVVFIPRRDTAYPAIIIELKWDKTEEEAISQIDEKKYDAVLKDYSGEIVRVGINYDSNKKIHSCKIVRDSK